MDKHKTNVTLMYSGGLDSYIMWHYAIKSGYKPQAIFVDLNHEYADKEWEAIQSIPEDIRPDVQKIEIKGLMPLLESKLSNQIIPSRNVLLATIGGMLNPTVWLGVLAGEQNGKEHDKSFRYFRDTTDLLSFTNDFFQDHTTITAPFLHFTKADTIKWALENGIKKEELFGTTSCYHPTKKKCGECLTCYKRYTSFLMNDIIEPGYDSNPLESDYAKEMAEEIPKAYENNDFSRFSRQRIQEYFELQKKIKELF